MHKDDILVFRDNYSQSYKSKDNSFSPWHIKNDPQLNMRKKTVLKQLVKYLPKNEKIAKAIEIDNIEAPVNPKKDIVT
jgi:recombinational DNA repair protein RecT